MANPGTSTSTTTTPLQNQAKGGTGGSSPLGGGGGGGSDFGANSADASAIDSQFTLNNGTAGTLTTAVTIMFGGWYASAEL